MLIPRISEGEEERFVPTMGRGKGEEQRSYLTTCSVNVQGYECERIKFYAVKECH